MRYLLVDHITEWKKEKLIRGVKNVAMSEDFLEFHFPKKPVMPGVMLLESISQLTGWFEAASSDFKNWFLLNRIIKCSFYGFVLPGDQVELEVVPLPENTGDAKAYRGTGNVRGKKKIAVDFEGTLVSSGEIEDIEEQERFFRLLTRGPGF